MAIFNVEGHEPSFLPDGADYSLAFAEEFDGKTLNTANWDYRLHMMGKRHPAWTDKGVHLDGSSNAVFTLISENGMPVSSQLQTGYNFMDAPVEKTKFETDDLQWPIGKLQTDKFTHRYGYYECRCRLQQKKGWWSAFWIQSPVIGASADPGDTGAEVDIMESFFPGKIAHHNAFAGGYGQDMQHVSVGGRADVDPAVFHRFGVLWDETGYTFYLDGEEDGHIDTLVSGHPEFILITTEVHGYRTPAHAPSAEAIQAVGDTFLVDYIRVFDKVTKESYL